MDNQDNNEINNPVSSTEIAQPPQVNQTNQNQPVIMPEPSKSNKKLVISLVVVVVILVITSVTLAVLLLGRTAITPKDSKSVASTEESSTGDPKQKEVCATFEKLCLDVPENWQTDVKQGKYPAVGSAMSEGKTADELADVDTVTITSPDGELTISLQTGISGVGGRCDIESAGKTYIIKDKPTSLLGYADSATNKQDRAHALAIIISSDGQTKFSPAVILTTSSDLIGKSEEHYCASVFADLLDDRNINLSNNSSFVNRGLLSLSTTSRYSESATISPLSFSSLDEAKRALDSQNFQEALEIIASAHY